MAKLENNWSVSIKVNGTILLEESIENATQDQEAQFKQRAFQFIKPVKDDDCKMPANGTDVVGSMSWHGGPTAGRSWTLFKCKACGQIHGRLSMMA